MKTVTCMGRLGAVERECATDLGAPLVVARPAGDDQRWCIIHVATGLAAGDYRWTSLDDAKSALAETLLVCDWSKVTVNSPKLPGIAKRVRAVARKHGAEGIYGEPIGARS